MNWVIRHSKKIRYHTDLKEILKPFWSDLQKYKWLITDVDFLTDSQIPINLERDYFVLNKYEFEKLMYSDTQIIWGIISAVADDFIIDEKTILKLSAESDNVWEENTFLLSESFLEIIAFDSSYSILKFKDSDLSEKFKLYFDNDAIELSKFNSKFKKYH